MHQLEIQYFYPLTEQINLDLDYTLTHNYEQEKKNKMLATSVYYSLLNAGVTTMSSGHIGYSYTIDVDQSPITVVSKQKPSWVRSYLYKILGVNWKVK